MDITLFRYNLYIDIKEQRIYIISYIQRTENQQVKQEGNRIGGEWGRG